MAYDLNALEDLDPIETVEAVALHNEWNFSRHHEDQIALSIDGHWRTYDIVVAMSPCQRQLRFISTTEVTILEERLFEIYALLNLANDSFWVGRLSYWEEAQRVVFRYALALSDTEKLSAELIDELICTTVETPDRFYPALIEVAYNNRAPEDAVLNAFNKTYGRA